jgi:hypothetical protein
MGSLFRWFIVSLIHEFIGSLFIGSLVHAFAGFEPAPRGGRRATNASGLHHHRLLL